MGLSRKDALKRLNGLAPEVEQHLEKIAADPESENVIHWISEIKSWLRQMEDVLPQVGRKTAAEWTARIAGWKARM